MNTQRRWTPEATRSLGDCTCDNNISFYLIRPGNSDQTAELDRISNRQHEHRRGLWVEQAPIAFDAGDDNLYRYVFSGPVSVTDPSGTHSHSMSAMIQYGTVSWSFNPWPIQNPFRYEYWRKPQFAAGLRAGYNFGLDIFFPAINDDGGTPAKPNKGAVAFKQTNSLETVVITTDGKTLTERRWPQKGKKLILDNMDITYNNKGELNVAKYHDTVQGPEFPEAWRESAVFVFQHVEKEQYFARNLDRSRQFGQGRFSYGYLYVNAANAAKILAGKKDEEIEGALVKAVSDSILAARLTSMVKAIRQGDAKFTLGKTSGHWLWVFEPQGFIDKPEHGAINK